jgi:hypothetical protein
MTSIDQLTLTFALYEFLRTLSCIGFMKTHFEFKSDKFPSYGNESEGVNWEAGIYGKRLAEYLTAKFAEKGVFVDAIDEDWGWYLGVRHSGKFELSVACAFYENPEYGSEYFQVFIMPNTPTITKWFRKIDVKEPVENLAAILHHIFSNDPEINDLRWGEERST